MAEREWTPQEIDVTVPSTARMYDYYLGGKDNYPADRAAAEKAIELYPPTREIALANRRFLVTSVRMLAERGIDQFLDLGSGIPTSPNVHEVAREVVPDARVVYVDNDPIALAHTRALRATSEGLLGVGHDVRSPADILADPDVRATIDFSRPVGLLMYEVLHFVKDAEDPAGIVAAFRDAVVPGSHIALSAGCTEGAPQEMIDAFLPVYEGASAPLILRPKEQIAQWFAGFELIDPGLVSLFRWLDEPEPEIPGVFAGVGSLPAR